MTLEDFENQLAPRANRFVVTFTSDHKTTRGSVCSQSQRRFRLADNAQDALNHVKFTELTPEFWHGGNSYRNLHVQSCPEAAPFAFGCSRFLGSKDIRTEAV